MTSALSYQRMEFSIGRVLATFTGRATRPRPPTPGLGAYEIAAGLPEGADVRRYNRNA